mmetsp:Transcript_9083/g.23739  ORF Transcript_9083/g.23739 Transcript_9083/m.23739 type:complete len:356 (-) Transcript_9083:124-1191(-)
MGCGASRTMSHAAGEIACTASSASEDTQEARGSSCGAQQFARADFFGGDPEPHRADAAIASDGFQENASAAEADSKEVGDHYIIELVVRNAAGCTLAEFCASNSWLGSDVVQYIVDSTPPPLGLLYRLIHGHEDVPRTARLGDIARGAGEVELVAILDCTIDSWEMASDAIGLSCGGRLATLERSHDVPFHYAVSAVLPPGSNASWEVVIGQDGGAIRSTGIVEDRTSKDETETFQHSNHGHYSPNRSISYEASAARIYNTLTRHQETHTQFASLPHYRRGCAIAFELRENTLTIQLNGAHLARIEGLEGFAVRPFVCFYKDNVGNEAWIRSPLHGSSSGTFFESRASSRSLDAG